MKLKDLQALPMQGSIEWFRARTGCFTGSMVGNLFIKGRSKDQPFGQTALNYILDVTTERCLPLSVWNNDELFLAYLNSQMAATPAMQWGKDNEATARDELAAYLGVEIHTAPFIEWKRGHILFGSSPDGLVADSEGTLTECVEIKCPQMRSTLRFSMMEDGADLIETEPRYYWQCQSHMLVTDTGVCNFAVWNPYFAKRLMVWKVERNYDRMKELEAVLGMAENRVREIMAAMKG